jgi:hypothetical protein
LIQIKRRPDLAHQDEVASLKIALKSAVFAGCRIDVAQTQHRPINLGASGYQSTVCMIPKRFAAHPGIDGGADESTTFNG